MIEVLQCLLLLDERPIRRVLHCKPVEVLQMLVICVVSDCVWKTVAQWIWRDVDAGTGL